MTCVQPTAVACNRRKSAKKIGYLPMEIHGISRRKSSTSRRKSAITDGNRVLTDGNRVFTDGNRVLTDGNRTLIDGNRLLIDGDRHLMTEIGCLPTEVRSELLAQPRSHCGTTVCCPRFPGLLRPAALGSLALPCVTKRVHRTR